MGGKHTGRRVMLTMPHELYDEVTKRASKERRTVSNLLMSIIADAFESESDTSDKSNESRTD